MANFGIFAEKTWRRRIEGGISEKQGEKKFASQILEFSQKKLGKEELKVELVKSSEKQGEKNLLCKFWNFNRKNLEKKN